MREGLYANAFEAYEDNGERFSFFSGAVLQTLKAIDKKPDIIHCHDWHAVLPFLLTHDKSWYFDVLKPYSLFITRLSRRARKRHSFLRHHPSILAQVRQLHHLRKAELDLHESDNRKPNYASELLTDLGSHGL